nr:MAG TPA: hypothetical protein [Caudoviricetes sp.]DAZ32325.1 MAG TPA: hypothetical protein [Caudoviricetes sp.]
MQKIKPNYLYISDVKTVFYMRYIQIKIKNLFM